MPNPALPTPTRAASLGWFPRKKFVSLQTGQRERAVRELCISAALIPAMKASPTHHFQSLYQCLGLGSASARLPASSTAAIIIAMRPDILIRTSPPIEPQLLVLHEYQGLRTPCTLTQEM